VTTVHSKTCIYTFKNAYIHLLKILDFVKQDDIGLAANAFIGVFRANSFFCVV